MSIIIEIISEKTVCLKDLNKDNAKYSFHIVGDTKDIWLVNGTAINNAIIDKKEWINVFNLNTCAFHTLNLDRCVIEVDLYVKVSNIKEEQEIERLND